MPDAQFKFVARNRLSAFEEKSFRKDALTASKDIFKRSKMNDIDCTIEKRLLSNRLLTAAY